ALTALKYLYKLEKRPKIITTPLTYVSVVNAIVLTGFEPVFVDIDPLTFCIKPDAIEKHLESVRDAGKYSIILPVDLMGFPVEIDKINSIARKHNLIVLEDASEAHGSTYKGKKCGASASAGAFSFYIAHNIQAGEMGAIVTNNYEIYRLSKKIKANGRLCECPVCTRSTGFCPQLRSRSENDDDFDPRFLHDLVGYNFKTMEFPATIALAQLTQINNIINKRQRIVKYLNEKLSPYSDILQLPRYSSEVSYLAYPLVIRKPDIISRKKLRLELEKRGIETRPLFGCIPLQQPAYSYLKELYEDKLPNAEFVGKNGFYIGCHQYLTKQDLEYVVTTFEKIMR
ncbi:MAG: hypothetical protein FJZ16_08700, partial [Candidatus Omnitrophica bacterium]|nr:hypothetical protein [Candidatus Omnitrophota bacterium]